MYLFIFNSKAARKPRVVFTNIFVNKMYLIEHKIFIKFPKIDTFFPANFEKGALLGGPAF